MEINDFNEADMMDEISKRFDNTPEVIAKTYEEINKEILSKGFLPLNVEFAETMNSSMEYVEKNPRQYIIEECIPACKELWKKNIYTFMCSNHENQGECWIEIGWEELSDENKEIYNQLGGEDINKAPYHKDCVKFGVKCVGEQAQARLLELAQQFQMQDVPYLQAYMTLPEYLTKQGCYDEVENPNYVPMTEPFEMDLSYEEFVEYQHKYQEWLHSDKSQKTYRVFNPTKITKPLEEYFNETGAIYDDGRVYLSDYHYQKHMNYVNSLMPTQGSKPKL